MLIDDISAVLPFHFVDVLIQEMTALDKSVLKMALVCFKDDGKKDVYN